MSPHHLLVQTPPSHEKLWQILAFRGSEDPLADPSELVCLPKLFYATGDFCTFPDLPKPAVSTSALLPMGLPGLNAPQL